MDLGNGKRFVYDFRRPASVLNYSRALCFTYPFGIIAPGGGSFFALNLSAISWNVTHFTLSWVLIHSMNRS